MSVLQTFQGLFDTARISVPTVVESAFGPIDKAVAEQRLSWWSKHLLESAKVDLTVNGREHAGDGSEPLIVMSNHQSLFDIPVLFQTIPGKLRMVAKAELFRVPVWGRAMLAAGFIRIDRADHKQAVASLRESGGSLLASGTRVWIAPEGTRSRTGEVGQFKSGGFRMALEHRVRILPVAIEGTRNVLPAKGFVVQTGKSVVVRILPPFDPMDYGVERRRELMHKVRASIATALGQTPA
jgi:1-acyl-sn-glycerol-3-phosphate acyltransferase